MLGNYSCDAGDFCGLGEMATMRAGKKENCVCAKEKH